MTEKVATNPQLSKSSTPLRLYVICSLLMILIFVSDLSIPLGVAMGVPYIAVILLSLWSPQKAFTAVLAVVCSLLTVAAVFMKPPVEEMWKVFFNRGLALLAIWTTMVLGLRLKIAEMNRQIALQERKEAQEKLTLLSGLLPICSSCKKIRDDKGYWTQIENYVKERSEADFTHSICPECARRLYPDFYDENSTGSGTVAS